MMCIRLRASASLFRGYRCMPGYCRMVNSRRDRHHSTRICYLRYTRLVNLPKFLPVYCLPACVAAPSRSMGFVIDSIAPSVPFLSEVSSEISYIDASFSSPTSLFPRPKYICPRLCLSSPLFLVLVSVFCAWPVILKT